MNKKGENKTGIGVILVVFVAVLLGTAIIPSIATYISLGRDTQTVTNLTFTVPADGVAVDLTGQEYFSLVKIENDSGLDIVAANYTLDEGVSATTGLKTVRYTAVGSEFEGETFNISYTYGADGYIDNAGGRAIAPLILIFLTLAIAVVALVPSLRERILQGLGK